MENQRGFSLIELLIVVAIILIIAAIAIPGLMRARMSANESAAVGDARTVVSSEVTYAGRSRGAAGDLPCLVTPANCNSNLTTDPLLDTQIGSQNIGVLKNQFVRDFHGDGAVAAVAPLLVPHHGWYTYEARPVAVGTGGQTAYCIDTSGLICTDTTGVGFCRGATRIVNCPPAQVLGG